MSGSSGSISDQMLSMVPFILYVKDTNKHNHWKWKNEQP